MLYRALSSASRLSNASVPCRAVATTARLLKPSLDTSSPSSSPSPPPFATASSPSSKKPKAEGSIASVFATLSGGTLEDALPDRFAQLKQSLITSPSHAEHLQHTWRSVLSSLAEKVAETERLGGKCIPEVSFPSERKGDVGGLEEWTDASTVQEIRERGVAVIKNVIPEQQVLQWKEDVRAYAKENDAKGFPEDNPQVYELYWTKAQLAARSHPNLLATSKRFLQLFHKPSSAPDASSGVETLASLSHPLTYVDRLRIRQPGDAKFALGAHIDGGGVERWECPHFRGLWSSILTPGSAWTSHDPWSLGANGERMTAQTDMYQGPGQCGVFRPLQGWLSLSHTRASEGTLRVLPFLQASTAYIILRPFFTPKLPPSSFSNYADYLAEKNWLFDGESRRFPGCSLGHNIELDELTHPHLRLEKTMVSIPKVAPGDMVLWHCDAVHSVESRHAGEGDSSVMYIPAIPTTRVNWEYVLEQRRCFERGVPPPDFPGGKGECEYRGRGTRDTVKGTEARTSLGLEKFDITTAATEEEKQLLSWCNAQL